MEQCTMLNPFSVQEVVRDALAGVNAPFGRMNGLITLAVSRTGTRTRTWTNGLYSFMQNLLHCTWTGTGAVPHCSDSCPGPRPSTGHKQCYYTRRLISHLVVCFCEHPACVCASNPLCRTICRKRCRCRVSLHCGSTCEASLRSCCCKCWDILGKYNARRASYKVESFLLRVFYNGWLNKYSLLRPCNTKTHKGSFILRQKRRRFQIGS